MRPRAGAEIELRVERLAVGGDGVGHHGGCVVFVPLSAPGDFIRARVVRAHARYLRAEIIEILDAGPDRRSPPCPEFGRCGGCTWMHLNDEAQRAARIQIVRDALERIGGIEKLPSIRLLASPVSLGYRARARVAVEGNRVGFRERASHRVVDVDHCPVLDPETQRELERLRARLPRGPTEVEITGFGREVRIGMQSISVGPGVFFQANRFLWEAWQEAVADACGRGRSLVEFYAGAGFYTMLLTQRFERVVAVERGPGARSAQANTSAEVAAIEAEKWAPLHLARVAPEVVLLNPPRTGCHPSVLRAIEIAAPRRVVYVSCDPTTLARDLSRLSGFGCVKDLLLIDALPQTHHVEVLCVVEPENSRSDLEPS